MEVKLIHLPALENESRSLIFLDDTTLNAIRHQETKAMHVLLQSKDSHLRAIAQIRSVNELPKHKMPSIMQEDTLSIAYASFGLSLNYTNDTNVVLLTAIAPNSIPPARQVNLTIDIEHSIYTTKILRCMERVASQLLTGTIVWNQRSIPIAWRNQFQLAVVESHQSDPSAFACVIASDTKVHVTTPKIPPQEMPQQTALIASVTQQLGSHSAVVDQVINFVFKRLKPSQSSNAPMGVGVLLHGASGIGKSHFLHILEKRLSGVNVNFITSPDIFQTNVGWSEKKLLKVFQEAATCSRSLLIFEDIDAIAAKSDNALDRSVLGTFLAALKQTPCHVAIIGTTNRMEVIDPALTTNGRLDQVIAMAPPTLVERAKVLSNMCRHVNMTEDIVKVGAQQTSGFVGADLLSLIREASMVSMTSGNPGTITSEHIASALKVVRPSVLQNQKTASMVYTPMFGVDDALKTLEVAIVNPLRDSSAYRKIGIPPPKGVLLTGPSGSGKSHALGFVANQIAPFATCIPVLCTDLISKAVGGTEKALSALFDTARQAAPCILLFDQIESLAPVRGFDTSSEQTFDRILSMLLLEMDGFGSSRQAIQTLSHEDFLKQHVAIVATTTHANLLDPAILRPGRFDLEIELAFPNADARSQVIVSLLNQTKVAFETEFATENDFVQWLVQESDGASVGQLNAVFQEAALACLRMDIHTTRVSMTQFKQALNQEISKEKFSNDDNSIDVNIDME